MRFITQKSLEVPPVHRFYFLHTTITDCMYFSPSGYNQPGKDVDCLVWSPQGLEEVILILKICRIESPNNITVSLDLKLSIALPK